jgi:small subunit ribosomal protein S9
MEILARAVGRRKEAVAQIQLISGTGKFLINNKDAQDYLQSASQKYTAVKSTFEVLQTNFISPDINQDKIDTIVKVKGGGVSGQSDAIKLGIARAFCKLVNSDSHFSKTITNSNETVNKIESDKSNEENIKILKKQFKTKGYLTQDSRVKERRKYGLKKARKASQYHKR